MSRRPDPRIAVYPGSFDPVTNGHLDVIRRAAPRFDRLVVAIARNRQKNPLFQVEERLAMLARACRPFRNVSVAEFEGLLVGFCRQSGARTVIRGLRAISDMEHEFAMAVTNRKMQADIETLFLMPSEPFTYLSSTIVREVAAFGGKLDGMVPPFVAEALRKRTRAGSGWDPL